MLSVSILITSFLRPHLLKWNLESLARQSIPFEYEILVLNDGVQDNTETVCSRYQEKLDLKYMFTGQRNLNGNLVYRVPGFALNIGIRQALGQVLIISCAEMFHINETLLHLAQPVLADNKTLATSIGMDDTGSFLKSLESNNGAFSLDAYYSEYPYLNTRLPFLMAVDRQEMLEIGGYDEDFVGFAYDDDDIMGRLFLNGCSLYLTQAQTIHLFHPRHDNSHLDTPEYRLNHRLYLERKGQIVRNQNHSWGQPQ